MISAKLVSLFIAITISLITVAFLSLSKSANLNILLIAGGISFASSFILVYYTLEFLIFREINKIYDVIGKIKKKHLRDFNTSVTEVKNSDNPLRTIKQEIVRYVSRKELEIDKLKKLEAYRREFIADVSHELKTPIFVAQGYILTLLDGAVDDDKLKYKFLRKAAKSLNNLDVLVQDLLTLSQLESGGITMKKDYFNLYHLVLEAVEQFEDKAQKKQIQTEIIAPDKDLIVYADYIRIMQVMLNLISNAIKYNKEKGKITIELENLEKSVRVTVTDTGIGIPAEHIDRIFERFYRVDKSRSKKQGGTGLGLSIVKHILENHNAKIKVTSVVGSGTSFSFKLKKRKEDAEKNKSDD